jgi:hypothetical protein
MTSRRLLVLLVCGLLAISQVSSSSARADQTRPTRDCVNYLTCADAVLVPVTTAEPPGPAILIYDVCLLFLVCVAAQRPVMLEIDGDAMHELAVSPPWPWPL